MPSAVDFTLSGDPTQARRVVGAALERLGHRVQPLQDGTWAVSRGSGGMTFLLGALAGKNFHTRYSLVFEDTPAGTVARFSRNAAVGALKGGALGVAKTADVFNEAARMVDAAARHEGILVSAVERG